MSSSDIPKLWTEPTKTFLDNKVFLQHLKMTLKIRILICLRRLLITLVSLTMTWFSEKNSTGWMWLHGFMPNLFKKSWKVSDKYLTAVKSAPKNPCSSPDQIVSGISKNCFFFRICLAVTMSNSKQPGVSALSDTFWLLFSSLSLTSPNLKRETSVDYGSFWNYYDQNLPIIDHLPPVSIIEWIPVLLEGTICISLTF